MIAARSQAHQYPKKQVSREKNEKKIRKVKKKGKCIWATCLSSSISFPTFFLSFSLGKSTTENPPKAEDRASHLNSNARDSNIQADFGIRHQMHRRGS